MSKNRLFAGTRVAGLVVMALCMLQTIPCAHEVLAPGSQSTDITTRTSAADVSGGWEFSAKTLNDVNYGRLTLKVDGANVSGSLSLAGWGQNQVDGSIKRQGGEPQGKATQRLPVWRVHRDD